MDEIAQQIKAPAKDIRIDFLVTPDCPHADLAEFRLRRAVARLAPKTEVNRSVVRSADEAEAHAFPGSPTVRINGVDLHGPDTGAPAYACRRYEDEGAPPEWLLEARLLRALRPRHVLFLCVANSARSQMAEAVARRLASAGVRISSAGSAPSRVNPFAVRALAEVGVDATGQRSKGVEDIRQAGGPEVDAVITLCEEEVCPVWLGAARRVHWPHPDPATVSGSDAEILAAFREVRDELGRRLEALF